MRRLPRGLAPLRNRRFRLLAAGQLVSNVGDGFYLVALPWYVLAVHGGPLLLGTVLAAYGIPRVVLVAVSGHASDRWRPWTVMMAADIFRVLAVGGLSIVALSGPARAVLLIPAAAIIGIGYGLFLPASFSIVPSLLGDADLEAGNALIGSGAQLATLIGPAIGGGLVAAVGPGAAFAADAISFAVSAITLAGLRGRRQPTPLTGPASRSSVHPPFSKPEHPDDARPADEHQARPPTIRHLVRSEPGLQVILLIILAANLGTGGLSNVALPVLAHGALHTGAAGYGALAACIGAGALLGTLAAGGIGRVRRPALILSLALLIMAASIAIVPFAGSPAADGAALAAFGGLDGFGNIIAITAIQRWAPREILGRVMGLILLAGVGIYPVSVALAGVAVRDYGAVPYFPAAGAILAAAVLTGLTQRSWRIFGITTSTTSSSQQVTQ